MAAPTEVWVVVVIVVAAGLGGLGFFGGYEYRGSPASQPGVTEYTTLSVLAAGTLDAFFPTIAGDLVNETPGTSAPSATQDYEGSLDVTSAVSSGTPADVAAVADFRLVPSLLEPTYASYEVVFASTPEVLVYNASLSVFDGINSTNWGSTLVTALNTPHVAPFGVWNASTDPNGYNEIFDMMLQGLLFGGGNVSAVYGHLYGGAPGAYAIPNPSVTRIEHESQAASLLKTGVISAAITYRSYAIANKLSNVTFNPIVGLAANNSTALADYAELSTEILSSTGTLETVHPAPVLFAATVPRDAPNAALGDLFLDLLLSPQGRAVLDAGGAFTPIFPAWSDQPKAVPSVLAPDVVSLPSWASGLLT